MGKIDFNIDKQLFRKNGEEIKPPKCWICNDQGIVIYVKVINGIKYECGARCTCVEGNKSSELIPILTYQSAEVMAEHHFNRFKKIYPDFFKKI